MARGDGGKIIFENDDDRMAFLHRLGQPCASHGWRVHAWVLMGNHFHLPAGGHRGAGDDEGGEWAAGVGDLIGRPEGPGHSYRS
jgi:hypothetical protein